MKDFSNVTVKNVYDTVRWKKVDVLLKDKTNNILFSKNDVLFPESWTQNAINITTSKYFTEKETSLKQMIDRVVDTIYKEGLVLGYFNGGNGKEFRARLKYILLHQIAAFNSPVYFNVGVVESPQCSACFINDIEDDMESILELVKTEGMLFKSGSGAGINLSPLRGAGEKLSGGGQASGVVSFMKGYDSFAGIIKSGGKMRRSAKMTALNIDHPDIKEFISCKTKEERKAKVLAESGYSGGIDGEAYQSVFFQNGNLSVRLTDKFMNACINDDYFEIKYVNTNEVKERIKARELLMMIAKNAWETGDPAVQFHDIINRSNTCKVSGEITTSNPCSEYMFLSNTACNLASLNLLKFVDHNNNINYGMMDEIVKTMITAMDIIIDLAGYPTKEIEKNSKLFRPLGLGISNYAAMAMVLNEKYDSELIYHIMRSINRSAWKRSIELGELLGSFSEAETNWQSLTDVIQSQTGIQDIPAVRNSQVTLIAPTGTISFMMDCSTTGIEPEISFIKEKNLVNGGKIEYTIPEYLRIALSNLQYDYNIDDFSGDGDEYTKSIDLVEKCIKEGSVDFGFLKAEHQEIFKTALGKHRISPAEHINVMKKAQMFLSGAISKTVNLPKDATVKDVYNIYIDAWKAGLKSISIYRDNSKIYQPIETSKNTNLVTKDVTRQRKKMPETRFSVTHKFGIGELKGYLTVGMYEDKRIGEMFIKIAKEGSTLSGLMDAFAACVSIGLQYGIPISEYIKKYIHTRFEPAGITKNKDIKIAKSIVDYIFRWIDQHISTNGEFQELKQDKSIEGVVIGDICSHCGSQLIQNGTCFACPSCGLTTGCS